MVPKSQLIWKSDDGSFESIFKKNIFARWSSISAFLSTLTDVIRSFKNIFLVFKFALFLLLLSVFWRYLLPLPNRLALFGGLSLINRFSSFSDDEHTTTVTYGHYGVGPQNGVHVGPFFPTGGSLWRGLSGSPPNLASTWNSYHGYGPSNSAGKILSAQPRVTSSNFR